MSSPAEPAPPEGAAEAYAQELTTESYQELVRLALWAKAMGPEFCLIGGWAAWRYHAGLGSRDIDVIFPDWRMLDVFLRVYYEKNGYETHGGLLSKRYRKRVAVGKRTVFIESMQRASPTRRRSRRTAPAPSRTRRSRPTRSCGTSGRPPCACLSPNCSSCRR